MYKARKKEFFVDQIIYIHSKENPQLPPNQWRTHMELCWGQNWVLSVGASSSVVVA